MTRFNLCPNCKAAPSGGMLGGNYFDIYECKKCKKIYCHKCGNDRCPDCGSKERKVVGQCWSKKN